MAIGSFRDKLTEAINAGQNNKRTRKLPPPARHLKAQIKLAVIGATTSLDDLPELRGSRFETLKGGRAGQCGIRINDRYKICFRRRGADAFEVEIIDDL